MKTTVRLRGRSANLFFRLNAFAFAFSFAFLFRFLFSASRWLLWRSRGAACGWHDWLVGTDGRRWSRGLRGRLKHDRTLLNSVHVVLSFIIYQ